LRGLCQDIMELRRGDHSAARLKIEQKRLERDREKTEAEIVEYFERWAQNPKVRDLICSDRLTPEKRASLIRGMFGVPLDATANPAGNSSAATNADNEESNSIQPNQTMPTKHNDSRGTTSKISCECLFEMTALLFPPVSARALKHNEKNDTSKNPRPQIVGHT